MYELSETAFDLIPSTTPKDSEQGTGLARHIARPGLPAAGPGPATEAAVHSAISAESETTLHLMTDKTTRCQQKAQQT